MTFDNERSINYVGFFVYANVTIGIFVLIATKMNWSFIFVFFFQHNNNYCLSFSLSKSVLSKYIWFHCNSEVSVFSIPVWPGVFSTVAVTWLIWRWHFGVLLLWFWFCLFDYWVVLVWWLRIVSWSILIAVISISVIIWVFTRSVIRILMIRIVFFSRLCK